MSRITALETCSQGLREGWLKHFEWEEDETSKVDNAVRKHKVLLDLMLGANRHPWNLSLDYLPIYPLEHLPMGSGYNVEYQKASVRVSRNLLALVQAVHLTLRNRNLIKSIFRGMTVVTAEANGKDSCDRSEEEPTLSCHWRPLWNPSANMRDWDKPFYKYCVTHDANDETEMSVRRLRNLIDRQEITDATGSAGTLNSNMYRYDTRDGRWERIR